MNHYGLTGSIVSTDRGRESVTGRPRGFDRDDAIDAAKDAFWVDGYERTGISDLEQVTGLSRSSLYSAFGPKRALFDAALDRYTETFINPLLSNMETEDPNLESIMRFFTSVRDVLLDDFGRRGCLMTNAIAEMAPADAEARSRGEGFRDRLRNAFTHALEGAAKHGEFDASLVESRGLMLAAVTLGLWLTARIDPLDGARLCERLASEVASWSGS
jgi:TetR/AcrR family transcriptional repressor of nem operon